MSASRHAARAMRCAILALTIAALAGCDGGDEMPPHLRVPGGDAETGRQLIAEYGCGSCHRIPGVPGARGVVAQPLDTFGARSVLAGIMANRPHNLIAWLQDPPAFRPRTAMPNLGIAETEARHMAAYLLTLGAEEARPLAPEPRLVAVPADAAERQREREREVLTGAGWVDRPQGIARIPIERAMDLLLEQRREADEPED